jgi:Zn-dependent protease
MTCACGTEVAPALLACPFCHRLVHAVELRELAAAAEAAGRRGDAAEELAGWRRALELLPAASKQAAQVGAKVAQLSAAAAGKRPSPGAAAMAPGRGRAIGRDTAHDTGGSAAAGANASRWGARGALATAVTFLLTKAKLLLLGLTKATTLFTMLLSVGVYWTLFGWWFAVLLVLSIYVHEMGHVAALRRFGLKATAPMFIPGFGALIRLRQHPANPREDARIGLAGPLWGLGAAVAAYLGFLLGWGPLWAAVARFAAWINLFNLLPVWQLDGGRAFHSLSRQQRLLAAAALAALWVLSREGLLLLLLLGAAAQTFRRDAPANGDGDGVALAQYVGLAAALTLLCLLQVPAAVAR